MPIYFRRRIPLGRNLWANLTGSGLSLSARAGRVTVNTRRSLFVRLLGGFFYRGRL